MREGEVGDGGREVKQQQIKWFGIEYEVLEEEEDDW